MLNATQCDIVMTLADLVRPTSRGPLTHSLSLASENVLPLSASTTSAAAKGVLVCTVSGCAAEAKLAARVSAGGGQPLASTEPGTLVAMQAAVGEGITLGLSVFSATRTSLQWSRGT